MTDATWRERIAAKHAAEVAVEAALAVVTAALRDAVSGRDSDSDPLAADLRRFGPACGLGDVRGAERRVEAHTTIQGER